MFFDDNELVKRRQSRLREPPPIPPTDWRPPSYFPNLSNADVISFDVETKETDFDHGPGWARGKGHICGFSVAARKGHGETGKWYFPIRHEIQTEWNLDPKQCLGWLKHTLETPNIPKVGANLLYDMGWLTTENIYVSGKLHDVQFAEALIDETALVNLDMLAHKYLRRNKTSDELYEWLAQAYGGKANHLQRGNIYRAPPQLVGPYGEDDADLPLKILEKQWTLLKQQELMPVFELENRLIPLLIKMRLQGVRVNLNYTEQLYDDVGKDIERLELELFAMTGIRANVNSPDDLARVFDAAGIKYLRTAGTINKPEGSPSFQKEWLKAQKHPVADKVNDIREHIKIRSTFVKSYLLESNVNGLVHCQFHPLKGDDGGTKTGRFASSDPNLQNIPVRTGLGKKVRKAFVPFYYHKRWRKFDYSQIEYRMLAHFAANEIGGNSADILRQTYNDDPTTDYHDVVQARVKELTGILIDRKPIKNINFGLLYGQTEKALAYKAGFTTEQARDIFKAYHTGAPYVKPTMKAIADEVHAAGYVCTVTGRRTRFDLWEPDGYGERGMALSYHTALAQYGHAIRRAYAYRGVNYKLQGSAADVIKIAMDVAHTSGVFDVIGFPLLQVHDELDFSMIDDSPEQIEAYAFLQHTLENSIKLRIPVKVDCTDGLDWSEAA